MRRCSFAGPPPIVVDVLGGLVLMLMVVVLWFFLLGSARRPGCCVDGITDRCISLFDLSQDKSNG
jgi:hypothetical protein